MEDTKVKVEELNTGVAQNQSDLYMDLRLDKVAVDRLWNYIEVSKENPAPANAFLVGQISKSTYMEDKDSWFYEQVIKDCAEKMWYKDWNNYYNVHVAQIQPPQKFSMGPIDTLWYNVQKQNEFNPPHNHTGVFSFVIFMKIPTHWKEQHALPISANSSLPCASDFQFCFVENAPMVKFLHIPLCPEDEGRMLFFPAWLQHQVFPFYGTEEERITISGNVFSGETRKHIEEITEVAERKLKELERTKTKLQLQLNRLRKGNMT